MYAGNKEIKYLYLFFFNSGSGNSVGGSVTKWVQNESRAQLKPPCAHAQAAQLTRLTAYLVLTDHTQAKVVWSEKNKIPAAVQNIREKNIYFLTKIVGEETSLFCKYYFAFKDLKRYMVQTKKKVGCVVTINPKFH